MRRLQRNSWFSPPPPPPPASFFKCHFAYYEVESGHQAFKNCKVQNKILSNPLIYRHPVANWQKRLETAELLSTTQTTLTLPRKFRAERPQETTSTQLSLLQSDEKSSTGIKSFWSNTCFAYFDISNLWCMSESLESLKMWQDCAAWVELPCQAQQYIEMYMYKFPLNIFSSRKTSFRTILFKNHWGSFPDCQNVFGT